MLVPCQDIAMSFQAKCDGFLAGSRDAALIITTRKRAGTGIIFLIGHGRCSLHNHLQRKQCLLSIGIKDTITSGTQLDLLKNYIQTAMKRTRLMSTGVFYQ